MNHKQKRQFTGLLIALGAVALLLAGAALLNLWEGIREEEEAAASVTGVPLAEAASGLAFTGSEGEALSFTRTGEDWAYDGDEGFPLDTAAIAALAAAVNGLTAEDAFLPEEALDAYGLGEGAASLTVTDEDGTVRTLVTGSATPDGSGCYARLEGEDTVYAIGANLPQRLDTTLLELAGVPEVAKLDEEHLISAAINGGAGSAVLTVEAREVTQEAEDAEDSSGTAPETTTEYRWLLDGEDVTEDSFLSDLAGDLAGVSLKGLAAFRPTEEELAELGLKDPVATLTARYTGSDGASAAVILTIGGDNGDGGYYCLLNGDASCVWSCDKAEVDSLVLWAVQGYRQAQADAEAAEQADSGA